MSDLNLKVTSIVQEAPTVKAFVLEAADGGTLPAFDAGAHIDVTVTLGDGSVDKRSYSLASGPGDTSSYTLGVLREEAGDGGSAFMHDSVSVGDELQATVPKNHFPLDDDAEDNLLIAGGIGVTPILAMARALAAADRPFAFHYAAKTPEEMAFRGDVEGVCGEHAKLYFDGGDPAKGIDLKDLLSHRPPGRHLYVCGPGGLIEAVRSTAKDAGWPENTIHYEVFKPAELDGEDEAVEIVLQETGRSVTVPADRTILEHLLDEGVDIDYDCKIGICGLCATTVIEGEVDHRDHVLTEEERQDEKQFCPCISRSKGDPLVIDA